MTRVLGALALLLLAGCAMRSPSEPSPSSPRAADATTDAAIRDGGPERLVGATAARPPPPGMTPRYQAALLSDHCTDRDLPAPAAEDRALVVLDRTYALAADDVPSDLVTASAAGLDGSSGMRLVRGVIVEDLSAMAAAWDAAGLSMEIESGYRSYDDQAATFDGWVARIGEEAARARTARPGHSEHQLGTAIDVVSPGWSGRFGDWAAESAEGAWMAAHAWEYGFAMSYPAGAQDATCFGYEPWHYRWIGRQPAAAHRASGLPLRVFLERYVSA